MSNFKIKNAEIIISQRIPSNYKKNDKPLIIEQNSNLINTNRAKREFNIFNKANIIDKILGESNSKIFQKIKTQIETFRNKSNKKLFLRNKSSDMNANIRNKKKVLEKNPHFFSYRLTKQRHNYQEMKENYMKNKENLFIKDYSYINNSFFHKNILDSKINKEESKIINYKKINSSKKILFKNNDIYSKRYFNKLNKVNKNTKNNINIHLIGKIGKLPIKSLELESENLSDTKRINIKTDRFNKIFNKYISNNIINGLNSFNKIKNLIKLNGFNLDNYDFNTIYKDNKNNYTNNNFNNANLINISKKIINNNKLERKENINITSINNNNSFDNINNIINKQKIYLSPIITKINQDKIIKLLNNRKNDYNKKKYANDKECKKYIINEVNKYYKNNNFASLKDFYKEWLIENQQFITINDIHFYLNEIIKLNKPIKKETIINLFFNDFQINGLDYYNFKKLFLLNENEKLNDTGVKIEVEIEKKVTKNHKINLIKENKENIYLALLKKIKEFLRKKIKNKENNNKRINFYLNYENFFNLIKNNVIIEKQYYYYFFNDMIRKIYLEYYDIDKNKINLLNIVEKKNKSNKFEIDIDNNININEIKEDKKKNINYDFKIKEIKKEKEKEKEKRSLSFNNINIKDTNKKDYIKEIFKKNKKYINNNNKNKQKIQEKKVNEKAIKSEFNFSSRRKFKNSDIINYL